MLRRQVINHGEHAVSNDPEMAFSVTLGSCVAACLHDPVLKIGGANHILLPEKTASRDMAKENVMVRS